MPKPQQSAPSLEVKVAGGATWSLAEQCPDRFTLVVFYRGIHCPICRGYLKQLEALLDELAAVGVTSVIAVSGDDEERAVRTVEDWGLTRLTVGYGQSVASMREWCLFVSKGIKAGEPDIFGEPGVFFIRPNGVLFAAVLNSMPFGRPHLDELVGSIRWINENDYPGRGEA